MTEREDHEETAVKQIEKFRKNADQIAEKLKADVLLFNGDMYAESAPDECLINLCAGTAARPNVLLILVTNGGDAHIAFRIARCLQQRYTKFSVYIPGWCKSAGTLIAMGAHEIVMSDNGQLGPLDVQISKPDELFESGSGLDMIQALDFLKSKAFSMFEDNFLDLKLRTGNRLSTKTATEIATSLTTGLFQPVYQQIEPTRLGEIARAMRIAQEYGQRLDRVSDNLKGGALQRLVNGYPSHRFVIDRSETETLFRNVRQPTKDEKALADSLEEFLEGLTKEPNVHTNSAETNPRPFISFVSTEPGEEGKEEHEGQESGEDAEGEREETRRTTEGAGAGLTTGATPNGQEEEVGRTNPQP